MSELNQNAQISIRCPTCGEKVMKTVAEMELDLIITCPGCGERTLWNAADLRKALESQKGSDDIGPAFPGKS